jgi:oxygen-dependent protoporphyrinogen oxidase
VSIGAFVTRRLGRGCSRVLVGPLLAGINSGDPDRLSLRATFPELLGWEETYGSLIRGARAAGRAAVPGRASRGGSPTLFGTLRGGLGSIVEALAGAVGRDRITERAAAGGVEVAREGAGSATGALGVHVGGSTARPAWVERADAVVVATPAPVAASLLRSANPTVAGELGAIAYGSSAVVAIAYPTGTARSLPDATGFIVPAGSAAGGRSLAVTACTWLSRKWPDPRFGDRAIVRAFVGRAGDEAALEASDPELVATVVHDLDAIWPLGASPEVAAIARWPRSMPQYEVGHLDRLARIDRALDASPGVFLTGSAYRGVGIADVVHQANETAERVLAFLRSASAERTVAAAGPPSAAGTTMEAS